MPTTSARALTLLSLLQTADRWSGPDLADRLGVSLRTVRRDVQTLRDLGYPVLANGGRHSTYRLGPGASVPPLTLDEEQAVAVALALQTAPTSVLGLRDASDRALATLTRLLPPHLRAQVDATRLTLLRNYWEFPAPPIPAQTLALVGDAVRRGHLLRLELLRPDGTRADPRDADFAPPRRVEPHHLALWAGRWYLVSFDPTRAAWTVLRVDRLHPSAPTGLAFKRRELSTTEVADLVMGTSDRGDVPADWPCVGSAVLALPAAPVARFAPGGAVIEYVDAERTRLIVGAWSWAGVAGILATFDADTTDVEPAELRDACALVAARLGNAGSAP